MRTKTCPVCGKKFDTNTSMKYCSEECRNKARSTKIINRWREKNPKVTYIKICEVCGTKFETSKKKQIYCCQACYRKAYTLKAKEAGKRKYIPKKDRPTKHFAAESPETSSPIMDKFKENHKVYRPQPGDSYSSHQDRQIAQSIEKYARIKLDEQ